MTNNDVTEVCNEDDEMCPYLHRRPPVPELVGLSEEYPSDLWMSGDFCPVSSICSDFPFFNLCDKPGPFCEHVGLIPSDHSGGKIRFETFHSCEEGVVIIEDGSVTILGENGVSTKIDSVDDLFFILDGRRARDGTQDKQVI